jgi:hypothetical protein
MKTAYLYRGMAGERSPEMAAAAFSTGATLSRKR